MLNRTYWKSILRTVRSSLSRFVAIFAIVALGVGFLSGLLAAPVDMRLSTDSYCRAANLYDIKIQSTQGLTDEDLSAVRGVEGVEAVMPARDMDLVLTSESGESLTTRLQSIPEEDLPEAERLNQLTLVEGRMPSAPGEIAVGLTKDFSGTIPSIGDVLTVNQTENDEDITDALPETFTVVGTVRSAAYFSVETEYTNAGTGTIALFAYAPESSFDMDYYTTFYLSVEGAKELNSFSAAYENKVDGVMEGLEAIKDERVQARHVISDAHPAHTLSLLADCRAVRPIYRRRITALPNTCGMFTTHLMLRPGCVPYRNRNLFVYEGSDPWQPCPPKTRRRPRRGAPPGPPPRPAGLPAG